MTKDCTDMTENDRAVRILRTMPDEPPTPSAVDVPRTMAEGRRRRRARRWAGGVAMAAVTAVAAGGGTVAVAALRDIPEPVPVPTPTAAPATVAAAPVPVPRDCAVALLPTGGITKALVTAGDPSGRHLAGRVYPERGGVRTVRWRDGALQPGPPMPGADASFEDINAAGVAVGTSFDAAGRQQAYVSDGGAAVRLRGGRAAAEAINEAGVIVGTLGEPFFGGVPARWASAAAAPQKLPLPAGFTGGDALAVGEDGTVVGRVYRKAGQATGFLWPASGRARLMPLPVVDGRRATYFWPESISSGSVHGRAVRDSADGSRRDFVSYRYRIATGEYERLPVSLGPPAIGAGNGRVLGTTGDHRPVVVAGSAVVALPAYRTMREYVVSSFSADGTVAGGYTTDTSASEGVANRPLRWTCR